MSAAPDPLAVAVAAGHLAARWGLDAAALGDGAVRRAVRERLVRTGLDAEAWVRRLDHERAEADALLEAVVVPETMLFRDGTPFTAIAALGAARALTASAERPVRILSAACSTGEEPFSAAIALLAHGCPPAGIQVLGIDASSRALDVARSGRCARSALRGAIPDWAEPYLVRLPDGGVDVVAAVRDVVELRRGNLADPLPAGPWDAILCRNVLVYLTPEARAKLLGRFAALLAPGASLFVGHAEVAALIDAGWRRAAGQGPWALVAPPVAGAATAAPVPRERARSVTPPTSRTATPARAPVARGTSARPPASVAVVPPAARTAAAPPDPLDAAVACAEGGDRPGAIRLLEELVRVDRANVAAHALLGVLHATSGDTPAARDALRRALYLDPGHAESRAQLALLDAPGGGR
ncbi:MAG: CheR family methyltransferase [Chloroflexota bacterium]